MNRIVLTLSGCVGLVGFLAASNHPLTFDEQIDKNRKRWSAQEEEIKKAIQFFGEIEKWQVPSCEEIAADPEKIHKTMVYLRRLALSGRDFRLNRNKLTKQPLMVGVLDFVECQCQNCQEFKVNTSSETVNLEITRQCHCLHSAFLMAKNYVEGASSTLLGLAAAHRERINKDLKTQLAAKEELHKHLLEGVTTIGGTLHEEKLTPFDLLPPPENTKVSSQKKDTNQKDEIKNIPSAYLEQQKKFLNSLKDECQKITNKVDPMNRELENVLRLTSRISLLDEINSDYEKQLNDMEAVVAQKAETLRKIREQINQTGGEVADPKNE